MWFEIIKYGIVYVMRDYLVIKRDGVQIFDIIWIGFRNIV